MTSKQEPALTLAHARWNAEQRRGVAPGKPPWNPCSVLRFDSARGVATQDSRLVRALHVESKAQRVERFHASTLQALAEVVGAAGLSHPSELSPEYIYQRVSPWEIRPLSALYPTLPPGALIHGTAHGFLRDAWNAASASSFLA